MNGEGAVWMKEQDADSNGQSVRNLIPLPFWIRVSCKMSGVVKTKASSRVLGRLPVEPGFVRTTKRVPGTLTGRTITDAEPGRPSAMAQGVCIKECLRNVEPGIPQQFKDSRYQPVRFGCENNRVEAADQSVKSGLPPLLHDNGCFLQQLPFFP